MIALVGSAFAVAAFVSFSWGAARLFLVKDESGRRGKALFSVLGAALIIANVSALIHDRDVDTMQQALGGGLCGAALLLFWAARRAVLGTDMAFAFSRVAATRVVQAGPYRFIRHPFYASYLLGWLGAPLLSGEPVLLVPAVAMLALYVRAAIEEEHALRSGPLGHVYDAYVGRTGMFLPRLSAVSP